ncbi:hypothetical protein F2Q69_00055411 [Brassica cretica]|uniref:Guanylate-binding protein/Atlastin C-terminal domain-containing protein n=1 Tax=Brassica cretica TaxID=69181 RepID=A0A8S9N1K6_BRACR|nr:hypothetical protein F2Q69_00055411 [Brassica cretica]
MQLEDLRGEFAAGLDAFTKFVFEKTRPKQLGGTVMTGPVLSAITQSYLDALNNGAVPTITSAWQNVEETECRRAYDSGIEAYLAAFDQSKAPEEGALMEEHEEAVRKALAMFNANAVGAGIARKRYEDLLDKDLKKKFADYKRNAFMEADLRCTSAIQSMEKQLRAACHASNANMDNVVKKNSLAVKFRSVEDAMKHLKQQLDDSERYKLEYQKRYDESNIDKKKLEDIYRERITKLQGENSSLNERCSTLVKTLESKQEEIKEWKRKYDQFVLKQKAVEDQLKSDMEVLRTRSTTSEARLSAAREQAKSAQEETEEWKRKYDYAVGEARSALQKAASVQERSGKETQLREDALREEFTLTLTEKDEEIKEKTTKIEKAEQSLTVLRSELKSLEKLLDEERKAHIAANRRAEALSLELQAAQATVDNLQQELAQARLKETALDNKIRAASSSRGKRSRMEDVDMDIGETNNRILRTNKRSRSTRGDDNGGYEDGVSVSRGDEDTQNQQGEEEEEAEDYRKLTVQNLKHELTKYDCGHLILNKGHQSKKEILALYEAHVLPKKALEKEERKRQ